MPSISARNPAQAKAQGQARRDALAKRYPAMTKRAPGQLAQTLYMRGLPEGVKMLITNVSWNIPADGDWVPTFNANDGKTFGRNTDDAKKASMLPVVVSKDVRDGFVGTCTLVSTSVFDTGIGPEMYLDFKLEGTTMINNKEFNWNNTTGKITISSTEWSLFSRPDFVNCTYQIQNQPPRNFANQVPTLRTPFDVLFMIGGNPDTQEVGINATFEQTVIDEMLGYALQGVFFVNSKAFGWVVGKAW